MARGASTTLNTSDSDVSSYFSYFFSLPFSLPLCLLFFFFVLFEICRYPGHEALWCHRRAVLYLYTTVMVPTHTCMHPPPLTLRSVLLCMSLHPSPSRRNLIPLFILLFLFVSPASVDLATLVTQELDFCDERAGDAGEAHHEAQRRFALRYKAFILEV